MLFVVRAVWRSQMVGEAQDGDVQWFFKRKGWLVGWWRWSVGMGLSPGPRALLSRAESQCLKHWERWFRPGRRRVAVHIQSIWHARDDPGRSGSWKSRGFRRQCEGLCQTRALFAGSRPARSQLIVLFFWPRTGSGRLSSSNSSCLLSTTRKQRQDKSKQLYASVRFFFHVDFVSASQKFLRMYINIYECTSYLRKH